MLGRKGREPRTGAFGELRKRSRGGSRAAGAGASRAALRTVSRATSRLTGAGAILAAFLAAALAVSLAVSFAAREAREAPEVQGAQGPEGGQKDQLVISLVGDIMLSRGVQTQLEENGYDYPYGDVREVFLGDDLTVGNLECPITERDSPASKTKRFLFRADPENAAALKAAGFDCMNLANNHSMDCMNIGLSDTMKYLEESGLSYVGAAKDAASHRPFVYEKNGIRVGILAYSAFPPEGFVYEQDKATVRYVSTMDLTGMEREIGGLDCDFKLVYFHWGIEYQPYKSDMQEQIARKAIDSGADFVVGAHPHVLQRAETYQGKTIYYSLGNFVFDRQVPPGTDESMILQLTVGREGLLGVEEIPVTIERAKPVRNP